MAGNRVEELEATVRELEATVSGLTDELVETKERLRVLEEQVNADLDDIIEGRASRSAARAETRDEAPVGRARTDPDRPGPASQEQVEHAVEQADGDVEADEAKGNEPEGEDDSSGTDDIIVA